MRLVVIGGEISSKKEMVFLFRSRDYFFLQNNEYRHHQTTELSVFSLKRNIQNVAAGFEFFTVVETSRFIGSNVNTLFISTYWTIHISNSLDVVHTHSFFLYLVD